MSIAKRGVPIALLLLLLASWGCRSEGSLTEVMLQIDSNLRVPDEIDAVDLTLFGVDPAAAQPTSVPLADTTGDGLHALPLSFGVVRGAEGLRTFSVTVRAKRGNDVVVARRAVVPFVSDAVKLLPIVLDRACAAPSVSCPATQTCRDGRCVDPLVAVGDLVDYVPPDGGVHGGTPDAGGSATVPGASLELGARCALDDACASGHCQQRVCCATVCDGACVSCATEHDRGRCVAVAKGAPDVRCASVATNPCGPTGVCGDAGGCAFVAKATPCGVGPTCEPESTVLATTRACDGAGVCATVATTNCSPFACNGVDACYATCASDGQCASTAFCDGVACVDKHHTGASCQANAQCASGACIDSVCCDSPCAPPVNGSASCEGGICAVMCDVGYQPCIDGCCVADAIALWRFDEDRGPFILDSSGEASSGMVMEGTTSSAAPNATPERGPGHRGGALRFDGVSTWVRVASSEALDRTGTSGTLTIAAWVKASAPATGPQKMAWIVARDELDFDQPSFGLGLQGGRPTCAIHRWLVPAREPIKVGVWTHLAVSYDGQTCRVYQNGELVVSRDPEWRLPTASTDVTIGAQQNGNAVSEFFDGWIDDVQLYDQPLTRARIATLSRF